MWKCKGKRRWELTEFSSLLVQKSAYRRLSGGAVGFALWAWSNGQSVFRINWILMERVFSKQARTQNRRWVCSTIQPWTMCGVEYMHFVNQQMVSYAASLRLIQQLVAKIRLESKVSEPSSWFKSRRDGIIVDVTNAKSKTPKGWHFMGNFSRNLCHPFGVVDRRFMLLQ